MELIALKKWFAMEGVGEDTKKVVFIVLSILGLRIIWEGIIWEWCSLRYLLMWCEHLPLAGDFDHLCSPRPQIFESCWEDKTHFPSSY